MFASVFWMTSLIFAVLDFTRPKFLEPFKIQEDFHLTKTLFAKAVAMALLNQVGLHSA